MSIKNLDPAGPGKAAMAYKMLQGQVCTMIYSVISVDCCDGAAAYLCGGAQAE